MIVMTPSVCLLLYQLGMVQLRSCTLHSMHLALDGMCIQAGTSKTLQQMPMMCHDDLPQHLS